MVVTFIYPHMLPHLPIGSICFPTHHAPPHDIKQFPPNVLTPPPKILFLPTRAQRNAPVAQLDRASDYESEGQGFESLRVYHSFFSETLRKSGQENISLIRLYFTNTLPTAFPGAPVLNIGEGRLFPAT